MHLSTAEINGSIGEADKHKEKYYNILYAEKSYSYWITCSLNCNITDKPREPQCEQIHPKNLYSYPFRHTFSPAPYPPYDSPLPFKMISRIDINHCFLPGPIYFVLQPVSSLLPAPVSDPPVIHVLLLCILSHKHLTYCTNSLTLTKSKIIVRIQGKGQNTK